MIRNRFIRTVSLFLCLFTLFLLLSTVVLADTPPSANNVDSFCVINAEYRKVINSLDMNRVVYPASTVKLMTALVAFDHFSENLEKKIAVTKEMLSSVVGRNMGLEEGEKLSILDLLHAMLCGGYNDAAIILAFASSGSIAEFCREMNEKAVALGAVATHYENPTGLHHSEMVTTAYDTALIGLATLENETLFQITKCLKYTIPATTRSDERIVYNRNPLISTASANNYFDSNAEGMNSGATDEAGDCVVTAGHWKGLSWVCVVMGGRPQSADDDENYACIAAQRLLKHALKGYEVKTLKTVKETVSTIPVRFSATEESVRVRLSKNLSALLPSETDLDNDITFNISRNTDLMEAPIEEGTIVGRIQALYNGEVIDSADLITADSIESHGFLVFMYRFKQVTQHPVFIVLLIVGLLWVAFLLWKKFFGKKKNKHRQRDRYF